jgi:hypothetical protein
MGWMGNQAPSNETQFKPYIYRGTGEDTLTPDIPAPRKPRAPKPYVSRNPPDYWANRSVPQSGYKPKAKKRKKPKRRYYSSPYGYHSPKPVIDVELPETWTDPVLAVAPPLRPAPGWRPTTGDDLEALLEEVEGGATRPKGETNWEELVARVHRVGSS